jgi:hypothetical protein
MTTVVMRAGAGCGMAWVYHADGVAHEVAGVGHLLAMRISLRRTG